MRERERERVTKRERKRDIQRKRGGEDFVEKSAYGVSPLFYFVTLFVTDRCISLHVYFFVSFLLLFHFFPFFLFSSVETYRSTVVVCVDEGGSCLGVINIKDVVKYYFESANSSR